MAILRKHVEQVAKRSEQSSCREGDRMLALTATGLTEIWQHSPKKRQVVWAVLKPAIGVVRKRMARRMLHVLSIKSCRGAAARRRCARWPDRILRGGSTMARGHVEVKKVDTVFDELDRLHQAIRERAYDLFRNGGTPWGSALRDWLTAERELVARPPIELRQADNHFEVLAALPGIEAKHVNVQITPEDVLIKADAPHEHAAEATVHVCEFGPGKIVRSIHFPEKIDPESAKAELKNGMLHVTAAIAKAAEAKKVEIKAA
jgi:HSP20 family protein